MNNNPFHSARTPRYPVECSRPYEILIAGRLDNVDLLVLLRLYLALVMLNSLKELCSRTLRIRLAPIWLGRFQLINLSSSYPVEGPRSREPRSYTLTLVHIRICQYDSGINAADCFLAVEDDADHIPKAILCQSFPDLDDNGMTVRKGSAGFNNKFVKLSLTMSREVFC